MISVRPIEIEDAKAYRELFSRLNQETIFRLYEAGEKNITIEEQEEEISRILQNKDSLLLVAVDNGALVGYLAAFGKSARRIKHIVTISIAILQSHVGIGVGTKLFNELEKWAKENNKHRLELTVMDNNPAGQALYKKVGFEVEGIKRDSLYIAGAYINDIYMSKLI